MLISVATSGKCKSLCNVQLQTYRGAFFMDRRSFDCSRWLICVWDGFAQPQSCIPYGHTVNQQNVQYFSLLTPWCRVLLEKLTGLQLVKKFPTFHGTRRFITALTSVRHLSLSWASPIQSIYQQPTSWRSILILSTHLRLGLPSGLLPSGCNVFP